MEPLGRTPEDVAEAATLFGKAVDAISIPEVTIDYACEPRQAGFEVWNAIREKFSKHPESVIKTDLGELTMTLRAPEGFAFSTYQVSYLPETEADMAVLSVRAAGFDGSAHLEIRHSRKHRIREVDLKQYGNRAKICQEGRAECIKQDFLQPIAKAVPDS